GNCCIVGRTAFGGDPFWCVTSKASVASNECARWELQFAPPGDVVLVAEGTHDSDTGTFIRLSSLVRVRLNLNIKEGRRHGLSEEVLIAVVFGMCDPCCTSGQRFLTRGLNENLRAVIGIEGIPVVGAGYFFIFQLGLGHGGLETDIPHSWSFGIVGMPIG